MDGKKRWLNLLVHLASSAEEEKLHKWCRCPQIKVHFGSTLIQMKTDCRSDRLLLPLCLWSPWSHINGQMEKVLFSSDPSLLLDRLLATVLGEGMQFILSKTSNPDVSKVSTGTYHTCAEIYCTYIEISSSQWNKPFLLTQNIVCKTFLKHGTFCELILHLNVTRGGYFIGWF